MKGFTTNQHSVAPFEQRDRAAGMGRGSAFTLIEVMIVVAIVGVILATGIPSIVRQMEKDALRQAAHDVVEACNMARAQAVFNGVPCFVIIRAEDGAIMVPKAEAPATRPFSETAAQLEKKSASSEAGGGVFQSALGEDVAVELVFVNLFDRMEATEIKVAFFPNGTCEEFALVLTSKGGSYKIQTDVVTGFADAERLR